MLRRSLSRPGTDSAPAGQRDSGPPARRGGRQPEALNALILQRMRTGIMVLDPQERVLLANQGRCSCSARNRWPASASRRAARSCSRHCSTGVAIPHCARPTSRPPRRTDAAAEFRRPAARQQARHSGVPRGHLADRPEGPATQARLSDDSQPALPMKSAIRWAPSAMPLSCYRNPKSWTARIGGWRRSSRTTRGG